MTTKRFIIFFVCILTIVFCPICLHCQSSTTKKYVDISFQLSDFRFSKDNNGKISILSNKHHLVYDDSISNLAIPLAIISVIIPADSCYISHSSTMKLGQIINDITMSEIPKFAISSDSIPQAQAHTSPLRQTTGILPDYIIKYGGESYAKGYKILHFIAATFRYIPLGNLLIPISNINLTIELGSVSDFHQTQPNYNRNYFDFIHNTVINKIDMPPLPKDDTLEVYDTTSVEHNMAKISSWHIRKLDYLIITSNKLKPYFQKLVQWKRQKGVIGHIVTMESIDLSYDDESRPLRIKKCLYNYLQNSTLQYVLLGGDDSVVPVMRCYGKIESANKENRRESHTLPTDLFYACFQPDNLDWNLNGDKIIGDHKDKVNLFPSLFVSRLPVRSIEDTKICVQKIIDYEKKPKVNDSMLLCGVKLESYLKFKDNISDAQGTGESMYTQYIRPYWNGSVVNFF